MTDKEFWQAAYLCVLGLANISSETAINAADEALEELRMRFEIEEEAIDVDLPHD